VNNSFALRTVIPYNSFFTVIIRRFGRTRTFSGLITGFQPFLVPAIKKTKVCLVNSEYKFNDVN